MHLCWRLTVALQLSSSQPRPRTASIPCLMSRVFNIALVFLAATTLCECLPCTEPCPARDSPFCLLDCTLLPSHIHGLFINSCVALPTVNAQESFLYGLTTHCTAPPRRSSAPSSWCYAQSLPATSQARLQATEDSSSCVSYGAAGRGQQLCLCFKSLCKPHWR